MYVHKQLVFVCFVAVECTFQHAVEGQCFLDTREAGNLKQRNTRMIMLLWVFSIGIDEGILVFSVLGLLFCTILLLRKSNIKSQCVVKRRIN